MPTVTVEADDLEALLFATSGIKDLESALDQRKRNPMVQSAKGKLEGAHDRLSSAWRRAKRDVEWPTRTVTEADMAELRRLFVGDDGEIKPYVLLDDYPSHFAQHLLLVEAGPIYYGYRIEWPAPSEPEFATAQLSGPLRYAARLNHYGRQVLAQHDPLKAISQESKIAKLELG